MSFEALPLAAFPGGLLEIMSLSISTANFSRLDVLSIYNPNANISEAEFPFYFDQLGWNRVILGDFNAHHVLWEPNKQSNTIGRHLVGSLLLDPSLAFLTPESLPTYYNITNTAFSTLDLTFMSAHLLPLSQIWTEPDLGSDHYPLLTTVGLTPCIVKRIVRPKWKFKSGCWNLWRKHLLEKEFVLSHNVDEDALRITDSLIVSRKSVFSLSNDQITPWYNKS